MGAMTTHDGTLLVAAQEGDELAFRDLMAPLRTQLHAHCYRMLGSAADADDALQEVLLRAWRGLHAFEGRSSLRSWLYRIATNVCLTLLDRRPKRVLPLDHGPPADRPEPDGEPLVESVWIEPYPSAELEDGRATPEARYEQRESVELAFVAALQHLPPNERAALLAREVLGLSARETAEALETTTAAVNSALQRARRFTRERLPAASQQATLRSLGDARLRTLVADYADALERGDVDTLLGDAQRGRDVVDAAARPVVPRARGDRRLPARGAVHGALAARARASERAGGGRVLPLERGPRAVRRLRDRRARAARRPHRGGHGLHRRRALPPLRPPRRAARLMIACTVLLRR